MIAAPGAATLLVFAGATFALLLSPGPNMALVVSQGIAHGARGGVAVAAGIALADLALTILVAAGVAALFSAWPPAFDVLRGAGAAWLAWLAIRQSRTRRGAAASTASAWSTASIVRLSFATSLLNPKALLFFAVFLPQFVDAGRGHVASQLLVLGGALTAIAFLFHAVLGVASARARAWARGRLAGGPWLDRLQAAVFLGIAIRLLFLSRPGA